MRSRRRKGRRNRDGLWICGIAVLAAGAVFTARTEILDLVTTEIAFVLDPKQEGGEKESDQDIAERVESTDGGKETLTDGGVDLAETMTSVSIGPSPSPTREILAHAGRSRR